MYRRANPRKRDDEIGHREMRNGELGMTEGLMLSEGQKKVLELP